MELPTKFVGLIELCYICCTVGAFWSIDSYYRYRFDLVSFKPQIIMINGFNILFKIQAI